jgi:hypothetical protein
MSWPCIVAPARYAHAAELSALLLLASAMWSTHSVASSTLPWMDELTSSLRHVDKVAAGQGCCIHAGSLSRLTCIVRQLTVDFVNKELRGTDCSVIRYRTRPNYP